MREMRKKYFPDKIVANHVDQMESTPDFYKNFRMCIPLTKLFNKYLSLGKSPSEWKEGRMSAINKKGSRKESGNYRPISVLILKC